jgi:hypothetical protein
MAGEFISCAAFCGLTLLVLVACRQKPNPAFEATRLEKAFPQPNEWVALATSAVRSNDYPAAVLALERARSSPGTTPEQLIAVQKTKEAMTSDLLARAERGDPKAQADLAALERSRSQ